MNEYTFKFYRGRHLAGTRKVSSAQLALCTYLARRWLRKWGATGDHVDITGPKCPRTLRNSRTEPPHVHDYQPLH